MRVYSLRDITRPDACVYIGRRGQGLEGPYGNPFRVETYGHGGAVRKYELFVKSNTELRTQLKAELAGKNLVCFCAPDGGVGPDDPLRCHGQVILRAIRGDYD